MRVLTPDGETGLAYQDRDAVRIKAERFFEQAHEEAGVDESVRHAQRPLVVADGAARQASG